MLSSFKKRPASVLIGSLLLLFAGAFVIRLWGLSYSHSWDEMVYLQNAKVICCGKTNYSELDFRPPLLSLLVAGAFLVRDHIYSACVTAALVNALAPVLLFLAGRRIVGVLPSAIASALLAFGPFFVGVFPDGFESDTTGNSLLTDSPALTLVLLGLWLMLRALEREKPARFAAAGFALSLAVLMRFGSIPSAAFLCLLPLLAKERWKALAATAAGMIAGLGPYLMWVRMTYGSYLETLEKGWQNVEGPAPPFSFYLRNAPVIFTWTGVIGLLLAAGGMVVVSKRSLRGKPAEVRSVRPGSSLLLLDSHTATPRVLQAFLWLWLLAGFLFFSRMPHKEPRYILPLAPPLLLLSGWGLALLCRIRGRLLRPAGILLLGAGMVVALYPSASRFDDPFIDPGRPEELEASLYLNATLPAPTPVYMNFNYPAFAYFTRFKMHELPIGGPEVYEAVDAMPADAILIAYRENESGDPKIERLNRDSNLTVVKQYSSLVIYRHLAEKRLAGKPSPD